MLNGFTLIFEPVGLLGKILEKLHLRIFKIRTIGHVFEGGRADKGVSPSIAIGDTFEITSSDAK